MPSNPTKQASLILDDGTVYKGTLFGSAKCVAGEVGRSILTSLILHLISCERRIIIEPCISRRFAPGI